jgi:hypothetical protein
MARPATPRVGVVGLDLETCSTNLDRFLAILGRGPVRVAVFFKVVKNFDHVSIKYNPLY